MNKQILEALEILDASNEEHWDARNGKPRVSVVSEIVGEQVTRAQIDEAAPGFVREAPAKGGYMMEEATPKERLTLETPAEFSEETPAPASEGEPVAEVSEEPSLDERIVALEEERRGLQGKIAKLEEKLSGLVAEKDALVAEKLRRSKEGEKERRLEAKREQFRREFEAAKRAQEEAAKKGRPYEHPIDRAMRNRKVEYPLMTDTRSR